MDPLEFFWDNLLSRSPSRIRAVFKTLDDLSKQEVLAHLHKMVTEEGWHPEQVASAKTALDALSDQSEETGETN